MKTTVTAAALAAALAGAGACSGGGGPDLAACKAAMQQILNSTGPTQDTAPAACHWVPAATVSAYASQISALT